jgi:3-phenylpropionate/trans-cinnamate dioxygenase ferredoxin reductase component
MNADGAYVIVGASLAGAKAAETLRQEGFDGPLTLIGEEAERPYERPPLSKDYLLGKADRETIYVHPRPWYAEHDVDLRLGARVTGIDPAERQVRLADGSRLGYAKLLLATGSTARRLPVPGADAGGVLYLRRVADSDQIKGTFAAASRVAAGPTATCTHLGRSVVLNARRREATATWAPTSQIRAGTTWRSSPSRTAAAARPAADP